MMTPIRTILDINMLGMGLYYQKSRTGVSRVAEQLLMGLWQAKEVSLRLAASSHLPESMRYAYHQFGKKEAIFLNRRIEKGPALLENELLRPFPIQSLPSKLIREGFYRTKRILHSEKAYFNTRQWLSGSIYHSPFYAIPDEIARTKTIHTVQTIYDLIPIFHPEWFPEGESSVRMTLEKLTPDTHVITVSEATKQDLCSYTGINPNRVTPIHLAASQDVFYPVADAERLRQIREQYRIGESPYFLSLATFEPRKNLDHLIRCFVNAAESKAIAADIKLVLVGVKGWKFDTIIAELAKNKAMQERIVVTGYVPDHELAPLYSGAMGFIYPSLYEGFGLPPLEAMQCGIPVIVSDIPSIKEVVADAAISVSPVDADALSSAIINVANSETLRNTLARQSVERASLFSWEKFIDAHIALYRQIRSN